MIERRNEAEAEEMRQRLGDHDDDDYQRPIYLKRDNGGNFYVKYDSGDREELGKTAEVVILGRRVEKRLFAHGQTVCAAVKHGRDPMRPHTPGPMHHECSLSLIHI